MGEITDLIFSLLGKAGRFFNVRGERVCFIIWIVCLLYWMARNLSMDLWVQTGSCLISLAFHIYGFINWKRKGIQPNDSGS